MKKLFVLVCVTIVFSLFLAGWGYSQSLEEIRAQAKSEVRSELGLDAPAKPAVKQQTKKVTPKVTPIRIGPNIIHQLMLVSMIIALIPATIAKVKGRSFIAWWFLGLVCFIVVFPISVYMKKLPDNKALNKTGEETA
ncbi:MAG: hypothetical protein ABID83_05835 [Candidatus Omnitrophota bacterium]